MKSRPAAAGAFQSTPTHALWHSPWLYLPPQVWTGNRLVSGQPVTPATVAGMCLWISALALESTGVSDAFSKSRRSFWSPPCENQGFSHQKIVWSCRSGWSWLQTVLHHQPRIRSQNLQKKLINAVLGFKEKASHPATAAPNVPATAPQALYPTQTTMIQHSEEQLCGAGDR